MDIGSLFLILALFILVLLFVSRPLLENHTRKTDSEAPEGEAASPLSALLAERDRALTSIQDLDFDHSLGKVSEEDYPILRAELMQRGAEILRKLDESKSQPAGMAAAEVVGSQTGPVMASEYIEDRLEEAIASRRAARPGVAPRHNGHGAAPDDQIEVMIANRRRAHSEKSAGFCHKCGSPLQKSDRFCPRCGASVA